MRETLLVAAVAVACLLFGLWWLADANRPPRGSDPLAIPAGQGVVIRRVEMAEDKVVCYARGEALSCVSVK